MAQRSRARPRTATNAHAKAFGKKVPLPGFLRGNATLFGIKVPTAGIVFVVALTLVAITVGGIISPRAPQLTPAHIEPRYAAADPAFLRSRGVLLGPPLAPGNRIDTLVNGDEIFPAMLS